MFIFVHSMNLVNVMRPLMAPRLSLQLYPSFTIIFGTNHGLLGKINACPTFVPILSHVPKMFQKCSKIPDSSTPTKYQFFASVKLAKQDAKRWLFDSKLYRHENLKFNYFRHRKLKFKTGPKSKPLNVGNCVISYFESSN